MSCRVGSELKIPFSKVFLFLDIGNFQVLLISEHIHPYQVSQLHLLVQPFLYQNQAKILAQICPKMYNLPSPEVVLLSKLAIEALVLHFDGKFFKTFAKIVIVFLSTFPHCVWLSLQCAALHSQCSVIMPNIYIHTYHIPLLEKFFVKSI